MKLVIAKKNLPLKSPVQDSVIIYLLMEHAQSPQWLYWAFGVLGVFIFVMYLYMKNKEVEIDQFNNYKSPY